MVWRLKTLKTKNMEDSLHRQISLMTRGFWSLTQSFFFLPKKILEIDCLDWKNIANVVIAENQIS